jgi:hypothetical protein
MLSYGLEMQLADHQSCLRLVSQLNFKTVGSERQYASLVVNGKTGNKDVVLTNSLHYLTDSLNQYPLKENAGGST